MSGGLVMPKRGDAGRLLADLNAEHAPGANTEEVTTPVATEPVVPVNDAPTPPSSENDVTHVTTLQRYNEPSTVTTNERTVVGSNSRTKKRSNAPENVETTVTEREMRFRKGLQIAEEDEKQDEVAVLTIRLSPRLSRYVDQYVARRNLTDPKGSRKYRKQDAVAEAFAAFYADHEMPPAPVEEDL